MAGNVKAANKSAALSTTAGGTTDFIKSGFGTPKACRIVVSFDAVDDTGVAAEGKVSIGFSDFTNNYCISHQDEDASAKVDCDARKSNTKSYVVLDAAGAVLFSGTASAITDGVRLTHTAGEAPASAFFASVTMYGGADLKISLNRTVIASAQDGTATITPGVGFDTSLLYFIGTDISGEDSSSSGINNSFGVCHINAPTFDTFTNRCIGWASDHNNTVGSPHSIIRNDRCLSQITEAGGLDWGLEVTAAATNSITVTTRDAGAGAGMEIYSLALDIDDRAAKVGSVDSPISGASWTPAVALGFTPQCVDLLLTHLTSENVIDSGADSGALGISSNTGAGEETFHGWYNDDGGAAADTANNFRSRVLDFRNDDASVIVQDHSHLSFNDGDWTYTINAENETVARKLSYSAIEEAGAATFFESHAMTALGVVDLVKQVELTKAITAVGAAGIVKQVEKTIAITALGLVTFSKGLLTEISATMTAVGVVTIVKQIEKTLAITAVSPVILVKQIEKTLAITAIGTAALVKQIEKTVVITAVGISVLAKASTFLKTVTIVATGLITFAKTFTAGAAGARPFCKGVLRAVGRLINP